MTRYAFPSDLLETVRRRWNANAAGARFPLPSDRVLLELLETCYHASLRTEEKRLVSCVLAYAPATHVPRDAIMLFQIPVRLTAYELARLSPVAKNGQTLIGCDYVARHLRVWGLFEYSPAWVQYALGDPPETRLDEADLPPDCLTVSIESPGELSVSQGRHALVRLRDGQVLIPQENVLRSADNPLGRHFHEMVDDLRRSPRYEDRLIALDEEVTPHTLVDVYTRSITSILSRIRGRRHGGTLVIVREPVDESLAHTTHTVVETGGLADEIVSYYESLSVSGEMEAAPADARGELLRRRAETGLRLASHALTRAMNQVSLLASVDGAVLLDDILAIQGFGVRFPLLLPPGATIIDAVTGFEYACDEWGLRHQSVFSFCQNCDHAVGLIVSQDGGVMAVKAIEGKLHLWDSVLD